MANEYQCKLEDNDFVSTYLVEENDISIEGQSASDEFYIRLSKNDAIKFANEILKLVNK